MWWYFYVITKHLSYKDRIIHGLTYFASLTKSADNFWYSGTVTSSPDLGCLIYGKHIFRLSAVIYGDLDPNFQHLTTVTVVQH